MTCEICAHAAEYGSWPQWLLNKGGTHCGLTKDSCHRTWTAKKQAHCVGTTKDGEPCHLHFSSDSIANRHRRRGNCLTLDECLELVSQTRDGAEKRVFRVVVGDDGEKTLSSADVKPLKPAWVAK